MPERTMPSVRQIGDFLSEFAPLRLAEDWDNVGLLVGYPDATVRRGMTCLTVTPAVVEEAAQERVDLIVAHHPLPFRPLKRLTPDTLPGRLLLQLIAAGTAVYSPHTAFDSAAAGINQRLAEALGLTEIQPLVPLPDDPARLGSGRWGRLPAPLSLHALAERLKGALKIPALQAVGPRERMITTVAVGCGSAGVFLGAAIEAGCELLVVGETGFHTCVEAAASDIALLLPGHYASERFAVEQLAEVLAQRFPDVAFWPSRAESDPLVWM